MVTFTRLLRLPEVRTRTGKSRSSIYRGVADGTFPKQVKLGPRAVGWPDHEITAINQARLQGRSDDQIREIVVRLMRARKDPDGLANWGQR
jgi:prophage regulatory protein